MKKRTQATIRGNEGVNALRSYCDRHSLIFQAEPREDYGVDCYIEVEIDAQAQNFIVGVQVKAGPSHRRDRADGSFWVGVRPADAAYWLAANYPVIFVYFHDTDGELYFRHVQAAFADAQSLADCTGFVFSSANRAEPSLLAGYVRDLARATPSIIDRFGVLTGSAKVHIGAGARELNGFKQEGGGPVSFEAFRFDEPSEAHTRYPMHPRVLGYSTDGRWVCESRFMDCGPIDGFDAEIAFVDLSSHAQIQVPLFSAHELEEAYARGDALDLDRVNATIDYLNRVATFLNVRAPVLLYDAYELVLDRASRMSLALSFGGQRFGISVGAYEGRDSVVLEADRFRPPRMVPLLVERAPPAMLLPLESGPPWEPDDIMAVMSPQRFEYVAGVTSDTNGGRLSFAIMTNDTHSCWGTRTVHLAHFSLQELRLACAEALRT